MASFGETLALSFYLIGVTLTVPCYAAIMCTNLMPGFQTFEKFTFNLPVQGIKSSFILPGVTTPFFDIFYIIPGIFIALLWHELGHLFSAKLLKVRVEKLTFTLRFRLIPVAFTEINKNSFQNKSKQTRIVIIIAGIWHNLVLCFIILLFYSLSTILIISNHNQGISIRPCNSGYLRHSQESIKISNLFESHEILHSIELEGLYSKVIHNTTDHVKVWNDIYNIKLESTNEKLLFSKNQASIVDKKLKQLTMQSVYSLDNSPIADLAEFISNCEFIDYRGRFPYSNLNICLYLVIRRFLEYVFNISLSMGILNLFPIKSLHLDGYLLYRELTTNFLKT